MSDNDGQQNSSTVEEKKIFHCSAEGCTATYQSKQGLRKHVSKHHKPKEDSVEQVTEKAESSSATKVQSVSSSVTKGSKKVPAEKKESKEGTQQKKPSAQDSQSKAAPAVAPPTSSATVVKRPQPQEKKNNSPVQKPQEIKQVAEKNYDGQSKNMNKKGNEELNTVVKSAGAVSSNGVNLQKAISEIIRVQKTSPTELVDAVNRLSVQDLYDLSRFGTFCNSVLQMNTLSVCNPFGITAATAPLLPMNTTNTNRSPQENKKNKKKNRNSSVSPPTKQQPQNQGAAKNKQSPTNTNKQTNNKRKFEEDSKKEGPATSGNVEQIQSPQKKKKVEVVQEEAKEQKDVVAEVVDGEKEKKKRKRRKKNKTGETENPADAMSDE